MAFTETTESAYIVVAQTDEELLRNIGKELDSQRRNHVVLTREPMEVLLEVVHNPVDIVVTGERFYDIDLRNFVGMFSVFAESRRGNFDPLMKHYKEKPTGPKSGTDLAELIYHLNPAILSMRYSIMPGQQARFVADIAKNFSSQDALFKLLNSPHVAQRLRARSAEILQNEFPEIQFYYETLKERLGTRLVYTETTLSLDYHFEQCVMPVVVAHQKRVQRDFSSSSEQFFNICGYGRTMFTQGLKRDLESGLMIETAGVTVADLTRCYDFGIKTNWTNLLTVRTLQQIYAELRPLKTK